MEANFVKKNSNSWLISSWRRCLRATFERFPPWHEGSFALKRKLISKPYVFSLKVARILVLLLRAVSRKSLLTNALSTERWALCFPTVKPKRTTPAWSVFRAAREKKSERLLIKFSLRADKTAPNSADFIKRKLRGSPFGFPTVFTAILAVSALRFRGRGRDDPWRDERQGRDDHP